MQHKIILGTANFGLTYGIANQKQLTEATIHHLLDLVKEHGLWGLDTAQVYGNAEERIGSYLKGQRPFGVITKLPKQAYSSVEHILETFHKSLQSLGLEQVDYLLCHSFETYREYKLLVPEAMKLLQKTGQIKHWGVSVYHPQEVQEILREHQGIVVELPINLLDQRFFPQLDDFKTQDCTLIARSVFLQGLFFLNDRELEQRHPQATKFVQAVRHLAEQLNLTIFELALGFVMSIKQLDGLVLGVNSEQQLLELINVAQQDLAVNLSQISALAIQDEQILLPQNWVKSHV